MTVMTVEASSVDLKRLVDQVQSAHELVLTRDGNPVARITSLTNEKNGVIRNLLENPASTQAPRFFICEDGDAMDQEIAAYEASHADLVFRYLHQYIAIYQGQVVDHDHNQLDLLSRIDEKYPDVIVLVRKVEHILPGVIHHRSPRFEK